MRKGDAAHEKNGSIFADGMHGDAAFCLRQ